MMGANRAVAKYCAELKTADARPRSLVGNHADVMRPLPGKRRGFGGAKREAEDEQRRHGRAAREKAHRPLEHA